MNELLKDTLALEKVSFTYTVSPEFQAINVSGKKVVLAKGILYVLGYTVIFVQPLGKDKFEILFN